MASRLCENGVDVCLDRWDVTLGGNLAHFMERAADDPHRVVAVVSETYSSKCNGRSDGAGVEAQMLSARIYAELDSDAVIPTIRNYPKNPPDLPAFLDGRLWQDFRDVAASDPAQHKWLPPVGNLAAVDVPFICQV